MECEIQDTGYRIQVSWYSIKQFHISFRFCDDQVPLIKGGFKGMFTLNYGKKIDSVVTVYDLEISEIFDPRFTDLNKPDRPKDPYHGTSIA